MRYLDLTFALFAAAVAGMYAAAPLPREPDAPKIAYVSSPHSPAVLAVDAPNVSRSATRLQSVPGAPAPAETLPNPTKHPPRLSLASLWRDVAPTWPSRWPLQFLVFAFVAGPLGYAQRTQPAPVVPIQLPEIPATAALAAVRDLKSSDLADPVALASFRGQRRYVWCRSPDEGAATIAAANIALNHSGFDYKPTPIRITGGWLVPLDFLTLCPDPVEFDRVIGIWNRDVSAIEPHFLAHLAIDNQLIDCPEWTDADGHKWSQRWITQANFPAEHLGPAGLELEELLGNLQSDLQSFAPIVRADWFQRIARSSIDDGLYLKFRGLTPLDPKNAKVKPTLLNDYLADRGVNVERLKRKNSDERAALLSAVTGGVRGIQVASSQDVHPSGVSTIVAVTDDYFDDNENPLSDPYLTLEDAQPDAHEVIVTLPNGWPEYTIYNGKGELLAEAAQQIVTDDRIPTPFKKRLNTASCLGCHGDSDGWKPFRNQIQDGLNGPLRLLADFSTPDQLKARARIAANYTGDLRPAIRAARDAFDRRCFSVTHRGAKDLSAAATSVYDGNKYAWMDAKKACNEVGIAVPPADVTGVDTLTRIIPYRDFQGRVPSDTRLGVLETKTFDEETGKWFGGQITRRQWERIYPDVMNAATPFVLKQIQPGMN